MNKNGLLFGFAGLIIGLVIGFFAANNLNQGMDLTTPASVAPQDAALTNDQIRNIVVKEQPTTSGMMPEISEILEKAKNQPNNFEAQTEAGDLYLKIQDFSKAIEFYKSAQKLKPTDYDLIVKIGNSYFDSKQFEQAEIWYTNALERKPDDFSVRTDLGVTFLERANPDMAKAINEFQISLKTKPDHEPTLYNLTVAYFRSGELDSAKKTAAQLDSANPKSDLNSRIKRLLN